jgi:hypothetical protein
MPNFLFLYIFFGEETNLLGLEQKKDRENFPTGFPVEISMDR